MEEGQQSVVPLTLLIDYLVHKTYHDLNVLSELLPRKSDIERKNSIYQFSNRTYHQFIRLQALVKWASKASLVDRCTNVIMVLDKQAALFVETADSLFTISKERLKNASFPVFGLQTAVDVMVTGTYSRLPLCIKDKIIPSLTLTDKEKDETLKKLTSLIEQRLVLSKIPIKYKTVEIGNGFVTLTVPHEFTVRLTVPNDDFKNPWRLLSFNVLVQNPKDDDPRPVVHPQQKEYITELLQSRLFDPDQEPLENLCIVAHQFCLLLQLEILYRQALRMKNMKNSRIQFVQVREYVPGNRLTIQYWSGSMPGNQPAYLVIYHPNQDPLDSIKIDHRPDICKIQGRDTVKLDFSALSIEGLLMSTIEHRSYEILGRLKHRISLEPNIEVINQDCEELSVLLCGRIKLTFYVDHCTGFVISCCDYNVGLKELAKSIYDHNTPLSESLDKIRRRIDLLLIKNSLQVHQIRHHVHLFSSPGDQMNHPILKKLTAALYVGFKSNSYCMAIDLENRKLRYLLLKLEPVATHPDNKHAMNTITSCTEIKDIPVFSMIDLDSLTPLQVIMKVERAILYINLQQEWKNKIQKCLGVVPQAGNWCLKLLTLPTNHPVLKQLLKDLTMYVYSTNPVIIKYSLVFNPKHKILPANTCGVVQGPYSSTLKLVIENFSLKWKEIHFLFSLLYNFQSLQNTTLGYIKHYGFHHLTLGYVVEGTEFECFIKRRQTKYRLLFYRSQDGTPNPHSLIREHLEHELGTHQSIFKLLYSLQRTAHMCAVVYHLPRVSYWGLKFFKLKNQTELRSLWTAFAHSSNVFRIIYRHSMALNITCYTEDSYCIRDASISGNTRITRFVPIYLLSKMMDLVTKRVEGTTVEGLVSATYTSDPSLKYPAASPQPATPNYTNTPNNPATPGYPGTPVYNQQPNTPSGYVTPSPANKAQPSPQNPSPFVQPQPSPLGAPSPAIMTLMSPQTPQYMPPSPAPVPSPGQHMQPSPGNPASHILGSPSYRVTPPNPPAPYTSSPQPKALTRTAHRPAQTLFVNKLMLQTLLSGGLNPFYNSDSNLSSHGSKKCSILENLMSTSFLKRYIAMYIPEKLRQSQYNLSIRSDELMSLSVLHETCFYRFSIDPNNFQTLHLSVTPTKEGFWNKHMIDTVSQYFTERIAVNPFKCNAVVSFLRILGTQRELLQPFINIWAMELNPEHHWRIRWLPLVPPAVRGSVLSPGICGALFGPNKLLFFIHLSHPARPEHPITIPVVYEFNNGTLKRAGGGTPTDILPYDYMAKRIETLFNHVTHQLLEQGGNTGPGVICTYITELLQNLDHSIPAT